MGGAVAARQGGHLNKKSAVRHWRGGGSGQGKSGKERGFILTGMTKFLGEWVIANGKAVRSNPAIIILSPTPASK